MVGLALTAVAAESKAMNNIMSSYEYVVVKITTCSYVKY